MISHHQLSTVDSFWVTELVDSKSNPAWLFAKVNSFWINLSLAMHIPWICTASVLIWWRFLIIKPAQPIQSFKTLIWAISMVSQRKTSLRPPKCLYGWYQSLDINHISKSHQGVHDLWYEIWLSQSLTWERRWLARAVLFPNSKDPWNKHISIWKPLFQAKHWWFSLNQLNALALPIGVWMIPCTIPSHFLIIKLIDNVLKKDLSMQFAIEKYLQAHPWWIWRATLWHWSLTREFYGFATLWLTRLHLQGL